MTEDYFFTHSNGLLLFIGHVTIRPKSFLGLNPGDRITQVGLSMPKERPGSAAINRTDKFRPYITYAGTRIEPKIGRQNFLMMFEVRKEDYPLGVPREDGFYIAYQVLYGDGRFELKVYDHSVPVARIFKPHFEKYNLTEAIVKARLNAYIDHPFINFL